VSDLRRKPNKPFYFHVTLSKGFPQKAAVCQNDDPKRKRFKGFHVSSPASLAYAMKPLVFILYWELN
jgi:hypothetical protein